MSHHVVFITGASRGIGRALAEKFLKEGYSVIGTSTSGKAPLKHKNFTVLKLDLSSSKSIEQCVKDFLHLKTKIDILINNAGIWSGFEDPVMRIETLKKVMAVNLFGTVDLTERLISHIPDGSKIINISSRAGSFGHKGSLPMYPDYRISKAALNMYTKTLAKRLEERGIIVASIHPGWVKTDMGGSDADITAQESADAVFTRVISLKETGQFWFNQEKFPW